MDNDAIEEQDNLYEQSTSTENVISITDKKNQISEYLLNISQQKNTAIELSRKESDKLVVQDNIKQKTKGDEKDDDDDDDNKTDEENICGKCKKGFYHTGSRCIVINGIIMILSY